MTQEELNRALERLRERQEFLVVNQSAGRFGELKVYKPLAALIDDVNYLINGVIENTTDNEAFAAAKKANGSLVALVRAINGDMP